MGWFGPTTGTSAKPSEEILPFSTSNLTLRMLFRLAVIGVGTQAPGGTGVGSGGNDCILENVADLLDPMFVVSNNEGTLSGGVELGLEIKSLSN